MASHASDSPPVSRSRPILASSDIRFNWIMAGLSTALVGGFYLDLWAHAHGRTDNTFFTPWHALLYSMLALIAVFLLVNAASAVRRGVAWVQSLPHGYGLSLIGVGLFALGGFADMVWHLLFGVEVSVDALLSPTHLVLATAGVLIVTGPLRAAWSDPERMERPWIAQLPAAISLLLALSIFTGMTQFVHPQVDPWAQTSPVTSIPQSELYMVNADGSRQTRLTVGGSDADSNPAFSADGGSIVYVRSQVGGGRDPAANLYRINLDGGQPTQLTRGSGWNLGPAVSPDGRSIGVSVFLRDRRRWAIGVVPAAGGDPRLLTDGKANDVFDGWSPDGTSAVFHSDRDGNLEIYRIGADGTGQRRLTAGSANWGGSWSPDGRTIAFSSNRGGHLQIYAMSPDGSNQRQLVRSSADDWLPAWSPDGERIAFYSNRGGRTQLYIAHADGSDARNVIQNVGVQLNAWTASWSPDGRAIVYAATPNIPASASPLVRQALGAAAILIQAAILMGILLLGLRGATLPVGSLTLILGVNALLVSVLEDQYRLIPGAVIAGVVSDLLLWQLRPKVSRPTSIRIFAAVIPVIVYACYFVSLQLTSGIGWSIHLWLGTIVLAGVIGLLLSYLVVPPAGVTRVYRSAET
jgi:TolB protein